MTTYSPKGGRPRKLRHHHHVLGMLMAFYVGTMHRGDLCQQFGVPPSTLSRVLNGAEAAMSVALCGFAPARIVWPSLARQKALAHLISLRQPMMIFTWGFLDGKNYKVSCSLLFGVYNSADFFAVVLPKWAARSSSLL
jgi:hypothetical protein